MEHSSVRLVTDSFNPFLDEPVLGWHHIALMLAWFAASLVIATRYFTWEPSR